MELGFDLAAGLRRQTGGFPSYGITVVPSSREAVNPPIGFARTVRIVENQARGRNGRLELYFSGTVCSEELQAGQPPKRKAFVRPCRFGRHHHFDAATDGMLGEFCCVVSIG